MFGVGGFFNVFMAIICIFIVLAFLLSITKSGTFTIEKIVEDKLSSYDVKIDVLVEDKFGFSLFFD